MPYAITSIRVTAQQNGLGARIEFAFDAAGPPGATYVATLYDAGVAVVGSAVALGTAQAGQFVDVPDGLFEIRIIETPTDAQTFRLVYVDCPTFNAAAESLSILSLTPVVPTAPGGEGYVEASITSTDGVISVRVRQMFPPYFIVGQRVIAGTGARTARILGLPAGEYQLEANDGVDGRQALAFTIGSYFEPAPPIVGPPVFYAVGGVLPNPALLPTLALLTAGRWLEVELLLPGEAVPFATGRCTQRREDQPFDAAPYLRSLLSTTPALGANILAGRDPAACAEFWYRYRTQDADGTTGEWTVDATRRFAVLAALDEIGGDLANWQADPAGIAAGGFTTAFVEPVQFVGYPMTVGVLVPPGLPSPAWVQFQYVNALYEEIEIRSVGLPDPVEPGYHRFRLPGNPLPCAVRVGVAVVNQNNAYVGTCASGGTAGEVPGGYLSVNGGYLKV